VIRHGYRFGGWPATAFSIKENAVFDLVII
jgi:hypothetical protein